MYFKVSKRQFYNVLSVTARAISAYSPLPAFSGIKIVAENDSLTLTGSDSDISIQTSLKTGQENYTLHIGDRTKDRCGRTGI